MTEQNLKNKEIYLNLCKETWDFDDDSMKYVEHRLSDDWEPVPEIKELINLPNVKYEDQRIRFKMDMTDAKVQSFFEEDDAAYKLFLSIFSHALATLKNKYSTEISYRDFISNKVIFRKNSTKIKKVFEIVYKENNNAFEQDYCIHYEEKKCADNIVKSFEKIGAYKKSAKELDFVISLNPIDWLLSSTAESFSSCFNINNSSGGYQYCLGLPFLCGDKNRMMLYITDGRKKEFEGIKVDSVQTRTWCILNENGNFNIVKWYPNDKIGYMPVRNITGCNKFYDKTTFTKSKYNLDILTSKLGAYFGVYLDMGELKIIDDKLYMVGNHKGCQQIFSKTLLKCNDNISNSFTNPKPYIPRLDKSLGFDIKKWREYGYHFDKLFTTLKCGICKNDKAGVFVNFQKYHFICFDCYKERFFQCESCGSTSVKTESTKIVETIDGKKIQLCDECAKRAEEHTCSCCGKYAPNLVNLTTVGGGKKLCKTCYEKEGYSQCGNCGEHKKDCKVYYYTFAKTKSILCDSCSHERDTGINDFPAFRYYPMIKIKLGGNRLNV